MKRRAEKVRGRMIQATKFFCCLIIRLEHHDDCADSTWFQLEVRPRQDSECLLYYLPNMLSRVQLSLPQCFPISVLKETILFAQDSWPRLRPLNKQSCLQQSKANKRIQTEQLAGDFKGAIKDRWYCPLQRLCVCVCVVIWANNYKIIIFGCALECTRTHSFLSCPKLWCGFSFKEICGETI